ncbi:hypothetical protein [Simplicispira sedimenti]|uniref:hypothetical protein n=1 Tax=Simplicispira sedimenti TaxID=2919500 RepID=UPI001FA98EFD|nr:hypothetical protein [Acidovorax sp. W1-6]
MADLSSLIGGAGVVPMPIDSRTITSSMTYTASVSGTLLLRVIAADGSGGVSLSGCATGAGAGESADKVVQVSAGDAFVITIGAGGAGLTRTTGHANGNDGGDTTVSGPGVAITVKGGKGGKASAVTAGAPLLGGEGGEGGSGGDVHRPGGRGGYIANCNFAHVTGGGAVNFSHIFTQQATRGGDVLNSTPAGITTTGGGGVRGHGGDAVAATAVSTAGGGAYGDALDGANPGAAGPNAGGGRTSGAITFLSAAGDPWGLDFASGNGASYPGATSDAGPGGGGMPGQQASSTTKPGAFGGWGAVTETAGVVWATTVPFYGAPSGAKFTSGTMVSLKGRDGVVFLRLYPRA